MRFADEHVDDRGGDEERLIGVGGGYFRADSLGLGDGGILEASFFFLKMYAAFGGLCRGICICRRCSGRLWRGLRILRGDAGKCQDHGKNKSDCDESWRVNGAEINFVEIHGVGLGSGSHGAAAAGWFAWDGVTEA